MEELYVVAAGAVIGLLMIAALQAFPGEPFDYENGVSLDPAATEAVGERSLTVDDRERRLREVELAVQQLKCDKLQELLGLEKSEIDQMIQQAKADALAGRNPSQQSPPNYARWFDLAFYAIVLALIALVMRVEYSMDLAQMLAHAFPREADTMRKIATAVPIPLFTSGG